MGYLNYRGKQVSWPGSDVPDSTEKPVTMTDEQYADVAALVTGEGLSVGDTFYLTQGGDTTDNALNTAMVAVLGAYISKGELPFPAFKVLTSSTVSFVTLVVLGIAAAAYKAQFDAIDLQLDVTDQFTEATEPQDFALLVDAIASVAADVSSLTSTVTSGSGKVKTSASDTLGYLSGKLTAQDSSITITPDTLTVGVSVSSVFQTSQAAAALVASKAAAPAAVHDYLTAQATAQTIQVAALSYATLTDQTVLMSDQEAAVVLDSVGVQMSQAFAQINRLEQAVLLAGAAIT